MLVLSLLVLGEYFPKENSYSHVYVVVSYENNDEGIDYFLCWCIGPKKKLITIVIDGEDIEYPMGSIFVRGTWLKR